MIPRINAKPERALREAITSVARIEDDQIPPSLAALDGVERTEAISLAAIATCYVVIDVCSSRWPNRASVRQIAEDLATSTTTAEQLHLDAGLIYAYLWRTVLGPEPLEEVVPDDPMFTRLPVMVLAEALAVYNPKKPKKLSAWEYLDQIESAIEVASALDASVLPAAVMRSYLEAINKPQDPTG